MLFSWTDPGPVEPKPTETLKVVKQDSYKSGSLSPAKRKQKRKGTSDN